MKSLIKALKRLFCKADVSSRTSDSWMFTGTDKYHFQYRISFPIGNGSYRETGTINVTIPADSPQEAKQKLIKFVRQKVQVTVIDVKQSS